MSSIRVEIRSAGNLNLSGAENILLQGTKNMSFSIGASPVGAPVWCRLALTVVPGSILRGVRLQARIHQPQSSDTVNSRRSNLQCTFVVNVRGSGKSPDTNITGESEAGRILREVITEGTTGSLFTFSDNNYIDEYFPITETEIAKEIYLFFQVSYRQWSGSWSSWEQYVSDFEIYSLSFDYEPVGCGGMEVRSIDGRLVSVTEGKTITYPILFLGRNPVREDAQGWKEVLVFQDRATTLRVLPQPIVLNEENAYASNATVESNGHWSLYEFDLARIQCTLGSSEPVTEGRGNDILHVRKSNTFLTFGLYDLVLLFSTDTSEEDAPYIVPVVLDYAVPLTVSSQGKTAEADNPLNGLLMIELTENQRCAALDIVRDRYWRIVGLPEDLTVGILEGVRVARTLLCIAPSYNKLGRQEFSFIIQSGIKRVVVLVGVTVAEIFDVSDSYVFSPGSRNRYLILEPNRDPGKHYSETLYVKQRIFAGYDITGQGTQHTVIREVAGVTEVPAEFSAGDPPDTVYEKVTVKYIGNVVTDQVGTYSQVISFTPFMLDADSNQVPRQTSEIRVTCHRNIELNFEIAGVDNRPSNGNATWEISKGFYYDDAVNLPAAVWIYLTAMVAPNETFAVSDIRQSITVRANHRLQSSGSSFVAVSGELSYEVSARAVTFSTTLLRLRSEQTVTLTFPAYNRAQHNATRTGITNVAVLAVALEIRIETRCPHFFRANNLYLQWDNNWTQHHYLLTNPDAVISVLGHDGGNALEYTPSTNAAAGDLLTRWHRPAEGADIHEIYTVQAQSIVPDTIALQDLLDASGVQGGSRIIADEFKVIVYNRVLLSNVIVPPMLSEDTELDITDQEVDSLTTITSSTISDAFELFNRDNRTDKRVSVGDSFTVAFDISRVIRSWSYSVQGDDVACGFLIEGWLDGLNRWEPISAVHNYSTLPSGGSSSEYDGYGGYGYEEEIVIDYITVVPRPWSKVRITVERVRNGNYGRIGQFQFYEGYPVLKRMPVVQRGTRDHRQLNVHTGIVKYLTRFPVNTSEHVAVSVSDGKLFSGVILSGSGQTAIYDGIDIHTNYHQPAYWVYQLVNDAANGLMPFSSSLAFMGITLAVPVNIIGVRYDTSIVEEYSTAGAIAVETSEAAINTETALASSAYTPFVLVNAWRHFGQISLDNFNSLALTDDMKSQLNNQVMTAQKQIYGDTHPDRIVDGTVVHTPADRRLLRYSDGEWENIGQDIIFDFSTIIGDVDKNSLMAGNNAILRQIADAWMRAVVSTSHQAGDPLRDRIAFTNPHDKARLVYDLAADTWEDAGTYGFDNHRGRQYYRHETRTGVRAFRIYIPGLADTQDARTASDRIRAIAGEIQFFEQFAGSDITCRDIRVNGSSVKYGDTVVLSPAAALSIVCEGVRSDGVAVNTNRVFAQMRSVTGDAHVWQPLSDSVISFVPERESNYTSSSVTLFYRQTMDNSSRMFPFFTFTVRRT